MFVIQAPDVYKSSTSNTYIVFGEARIEDLNSQAQANAAQQFAPHADAFKKEDFAEVAEVEEEEEEAVDEAGVEEKDIELIMQQAACSRTKAVKALMASKGDIVNAIMVSFLQFSILHGN